MSRSRSLFLVFLLVFACATPTLAERLLSAVKELDALVEVHVSDPARARETHAVVALFRNQVETYYNNIEGILEDFSHLNADYDASRQQFRELLDRAETQRLQSYNRFIDLTLRARQSLMPDEWNAIHNALRAARGQ